MQSILCWSETSFELARSSVIVLVLFVAAAFRSADTGTRNPNSRSVARDLVWSSTAAIVIASLSSIALPLPLSLLS